MSGALWVVVPLGLLAATTMVVHRLFGADGAILYVSLAVLTSVVWIVNGIAPPRFR